MTIVFHSSGSKRSLAYSFKNMVLEPIYLDLSSSDDEDEDPNWDRNDATGPTAFTCFPKVIHSLVSRNRGEIACLCASFWT